MYAANPNYYSQPWWVLIPVIIAFMVAMYKTWKGNKQHRPFFVSVCMECGAEGHGKDKACSRCGSTELQRFWEES